MTKTLTEQWREGKLPEGWYYVFYADQSDHYISCDTENYDGIDYWNECEWHFDDDPVIKVLAPVPSYDEYKELVRKSDKLDKIMFDSATNQGDCQQIVEDNLNRQIERLQKQLNEAQKVIKLYAKTTIGHKQDDGTYAFHCVSGEIDWLNPLNSRTYMETIVYDPRPAKKWLKKWGVK